MPFQQQQEEQQGSSPFLKPSKFSQKDELLGQSLPSLKELAQYLEVRHHFCILSF
jgi:hypothetical protein